MKFNKKQLEQIADSLQIKESTIQNWKKVPRYAQNVVSDVLNNGDKRAVNDHYGYNEVVNSRLDSNKWKPIKDQTRELLRSEDRVSRVISFDFFKDTGKIFLLTDEE